MVYTLGSVVNSVLYDRRKRRGVVGVSLGRWGNP